MQNHWQLPEMVGTGPELQPLADRVSGAWLAFARTGNPSHPGIPQWPAYNATERPTMHINNEWAVSTIRIVKSVSHWRRSRGCRCSEGDTMKLASHLRPRCSSSTRAPCD